MDPATHLLTGACLARTGFHRRIAYATAAMVVAAEFPDIDTLWSLRGPISGFEHHRGITHTFVGVPFEAALLLLGVFAWDKWRRTRGQTNHSTLPGARGTGKIRWGTLYGLLLIALLSHLLLDYTNSYGLRPFFPFHDEWYAASIVFIFDPLIFLVLVAGLLMPSLFKLVSGEIGARHEVKAGSGWARASLVCVVLLWGIRLYEHGQAIDLTQRSTLRAPATALPEDALPSPAASTAPATSGVAETETAPSFVRPLLQPQQTLATPDPLSVFRWYAAMDFGPAIQLATVDSRLGTLVPSNLLVKPAPTPALLVAERSRLGGIYLDWSPMPILILDPARVGTGGGNSETIRFQDPRFMADTSILHRQGAPPLTGTVVVGPRGDVLAEGMDGHFER